MVVSNLIQMNPVINESIELITSATTNQVVNNEVMSDESLGLYQVPFELAILLSCCYGCVSLCAVIGNSMIIWIVFKSRRMRNVTNYFIANLALADILIGAFAIPFQFQAALLQRWDLPWFMCSFCPTVQVISVNVSVFTLTAIALDRYRAVLYPLTARTNKLRIKFIIISIWLLAIVLSIPTSIAFNVELIWDELGTYSVPICHNTGLSPSMFRHYSHMLVGVQYVIPLVIISYAYLRMGLYLHRNDEMTIDDVNSSRCDTQRVERNKKRVIKMLFIVVALFTLCWLPFQMYNILQEIYPEINEYRYINLIWFCCHWLAMSNSCYNPFIYVIYSERFNAEFYEKFGHCLFCKYIVNCGPHQQGLNQNHHLRSTFRTNQSEFDQINWSIINNSNNNSLNNINMSNNGNFNFNHNSNHSLSTPTPIPSTTTSPLVIPSHQLQSKQKITQSNSMLSKTNLIFSKNNHMINDIQLSQLDMNEKKNHNENFELKQMTKKDNDMSSHEKQTDESQ